MCNKVDYLHISSCNKVDYSYIFSYNDVDYLYNFPCNNVDDSLIQSLSIFYCIKSLKVMKRFENNVYTCSLAIKICKNLGNVSVSNKITFDI